MRTRSVNGGDIIDHGPVGRVLCVQGRALVQDRHLGRQALYMASYGTEKGMLIVLDYENDRAEEYEFPEAVTAWNLMQARDGLVYIGGYTPGRLLAFDTERRRFVDLPEPDHVIEAAQSVVCDLAEGPNGSIYYGTYPDCRLYRYRPEEGKVELVAQPVQDELYLRWVTALPDGRVLGFAGCHRCRLVEIRPDTGSVRTLTPDWLQGPSNWGPLYLVGPYAVHQAMDSRNGGAPILVVYDWQSGTLADTISILDINEPIVVGAGDGGLLIGARGGAIEKVLLPEGRRQAVWPDLRLPDLPLSGILRDDKGRLISPSGRDYWVADPATGWAETRRLPARGAYIAALGLKAMDNGQVWGSFHLGQSIFRLATDGNDALNLGPVVEVGGEVYDLEEKDGVLYMASYIEAVLSRFDPAAPWHPGKEVASNPQELARLGHDQYRPCAGVAWAPDGRLAVGSMAKYGIAGGALSFYDPDTGSLEVVRDPVPGQAITALDGDGDRLCLGTSIHSNGVSAEGAWAQVFLWDQKPGRIASQHELSGIEGVSWVALLPGPAVLVSAAGKLFLWHTDTDEIETVLEQGSMQTNGCARGRDGKLWMVINGTLMRYDAGADELVSYALGAGELSSPMTVGHDGTAYCRRGLHVVAFRDLA